MCSTSFLFLTSCELWVYGYTLSVGMFNCFSFICYQLASAGFFESMVMVRSFQFVLTATSSEAEQLISSRKTSWGDECFGRLQIFKAADSLS